ncbi:MAG: hypothetical protein JWN45_1720 [Acidobacteriaceae bacterium]|nr:hypothetical protein [Acidobacteriaceae bacterium]
MRRAVGILVCIALVSLPGNAAPKPHVVALGRWTTISWREQDSAGKPLQLKIRPLYVDGRTKEFTTDMAHDVTEQTFVVQRIYRLNDSLPQQPGPTQWQWQRGGWLLVDRVSGKVQPIALSEFDPDTSAVNWYRDYAAYCGTSDDGRKLVALVVQIGRRKPLLKKAVGEVNQFPQTCSAPLWERNPVRVTFQITPGQKLMFAVKSRAVDAVTSDETEGGD